VHPHLVVLPARYRGFRRAESRRFWGSARVDRGSERFTTPASLRRTGIERGPRALGFCPGNTSVGVVFPRRSVL